MDNTNNQKDILFQHTYLKALLDNKNNIAHWKVYKEKYEEVIKNLNFYNEKFKHSVCIPVGRKAFVKGELVHTNDVWVTLGCGYFLKTSTKKAIDICQRRIKAADELIEKWEKESKLLESMRNYSTNKDILGGGEDSNEIVEPFDEEQEKKWREDHKRKEKKYREQLREIKEKTGSVTMSDEKDIWEHLEALEMQEELEDELNRLGCNESSSEDYMTDSDDTSKGNEELESVDDVRTDLTNVNIQKSSEEEKKSKKVTFSGVSDIVKFNSPCENIKVKATQDAVMDEVVEKIPNSKLLENGTQQERPVSKFKMNRRQ